MHSKPLRQSLKPHGFWESNSGPHSDKASTLLAELFPCPSRYFNSEVPIEGLGHGSVGDSKGHQSLACSFPFLAST